MPAGRHKFTSEQGSTFARNVTVALAGEEVPLVDAWLQVRKGVGGALIFDLGTGGNGLTIAGGTVTIAIDETDTAAAAAGTYVYDLFVEPAAGVVKLLEGAWEHKARVTVPA